MEVIDTFIKACEKSKCFTDLPEELLSEVCQYIRGTGAVPTVVDTVELIQKLSYFLIDDLKVNKNLLVVIESIWMSREDKPNCLRQLIEVLKPYLPPNDSQKSKFNNRNYHQNIQNSALLPQLSFNSQGDNKIAVWFQEKSWKCYGLFYFILQKLPKSEMSSQMNWIIPGILNLLDNADNLKGIKLMGVIILNQWLDCYLMKGNDSNGENNQDNESKWLKFNQVGIYDMVEPILSNMLHYVPPLYSLDDTLQIWEILYPTILKLYKIQYEQIVYDEITNKIENKIEDGVKNENKHLYNKQLQKLITKNILQYNIPHCEVKYDKLTEFQLIQLRALIRELGSSSVILLTRISYTLGEILVKSPYITLFPNIVLEILQLLDELIQIIPKDRITKHRFDLLGLIIILWKKCNNEGAIHETNRRQMLHIESKLGFSPDELRCLNFVPLNF